MNCGGTTEPFVRLIICLLNERKVFLWQIVKFKLNILVDRKAHKGL